MKSFLKKAYGYLRAGWWVVVLIVGTISSVGIIYLVKKKRKEEEIVDPSSKKESFAVSVQEKVKDAVADARVETALAKAKNEAERAEIVEIQSITDSRERRKKLAAKLRDSL